MTRKHFELIARALADLHNESNHEMGADDHLRNRLIFHIGQACRQSNPRFSFDKFEAKIRKWCKD